MSENVPRRRSLVRGLVLGGLALLLAAQNQAVAQSWTLTTLYSFCAMAQCIDGRDPRGTLISDNAGDLYGTTASGGFNLLGTVFKIDPFGNETVLHNFCSRFDCNDGSRPFAGLIRNAKGVLYGTARGSGSRHHSGNPGGVVFKVTSGGEKSLCNFGSVHCPTGALPMGSLIRDAEDNLYGTTSGGGTNFITNFNCCGTVFKVSPDGEETVLYSFCSAANCRDGASPQAGLTIDPSGNFYGTTLFGGAFQAGTVFELTAGGTEKVLYSFCVAVSCANGINGSHPGTGLVRDASGNLFGTTLYGGLNDKGTVFEVTPGGVEKVLYSFCSVAACTDGEYPQAGLILDGLGNLYGTTKSGGDNFHGTVFKVAADGTESVLYSFCPIAGCSDGKAPRAGLLMDKSGNLFGTTSAGGVNGKGGTVFELAPP